MKRYCPKCSQAGVKDDACTHITCKRCKATYCFWCGEEIDGENLFTHNNGPNDEDWSRVRKCPPFTEDICSYDKDWPDNDEGVQELFIKRRTIKLLRGFLEKHGEETYNKLVEKFPSCGAASGFTLEEIKTAKVELIDWGNNPNNSDEDSDY